MEECVPLERDNPRKAANILSRLFFAWMRKICYEGSTRGLDIKNLYKAQHQDQSQNLGDTLEQEWIKEKERVKLKDQIPSLLRVLIRTYYLQYLYCGLLLFITNVGLRMAQPLVLARLIRLFTSGNYTIQDVLIHGSGLCILTLGSALLIHHSNCGSNLVGMRIRIAISSLIYRKVLRLSQFSLGKTAAGQVVNLLSNDVARFDIVVLGLHHIWIGPIQVMLVAYLMWIQIGISSLMGIFVLLLITLPLQMLIGSVSSKYRMQIAKRTDKRVRLMAEIISGIQVIKMYVWETPFEHVVEDARKQEIKYVSKASYVRGIQSSFAIFLEKAALAVTVIFYYLTSHEITADFVFASSMYFNYLKLTLAVLLPLGLTVGAEVLVSIRRLQDFLLLEEKETLKIHSTEDDSVCLKNIHASWISSSPTLSNFCVNITPGTLCAVIGPVGSGKSSFLKLLLGELTPTMGTIELPNDISYASQGPWLFASSVRNNILFGQIFNKSRYRDVVKVCALEKDFEQFPEGDKTIVGDRGVALSGGQRARINLARAVYKESSIYLLDDPLSAVDTKVGRHLFDKCILEYLRGKTRVLVTHQLQHLKRADKIIVLKEGVIEAQGTFEELTQSELDFTKLLVASDESQECNLRRKTERTLSISSTVSSVVDSSEDKVVSENIESKNGYQGSALLSYMKNSNSFMLISFVVLFFMSSQLLLTGADYWITLWTTQEQIRYSYKNSTSQNNIEIKNVEVIESGESIYQYIPAETELGNSTNHFGNSLNEWNFTEEVSINGQIHTLLKSQILMIIYATIIVSAIVIAILRSLTYYYSCMRSSKSLHHKMFHCLLESPMRFFDTTPAGRILNRFSKDMGTIDELLPQALINVIQIFLIVGGSLLMILISNPYISVILIILALIFIQIRKWYITTARSIKLIEGVVKSPVFSHISSTIDGLTTIRATRNEDILKLQFDQLQDIHTSAWYLTVLCSSCFGLWLDLVCVSLVCAVVGSFILLDQYISVGGSFIGLGISQSLILVGMLQFCMRQVAEVVNHLTSVERVLEYTQLEKEHQSTTYEDSQGDKLTEPWPRKGEIIFQNLFLKYSEVDQPVLKNLNLRILPSQKIGIVGRTGAGKSSMISALFRLALTDGKILIDGVDTKTIPLKDLRKNISIIPQEPVLFSASVRYNLDPFNEFEDSKLWDVLDEVKLKNKIGSLDFMVTEGGNNFSVGERQLVCLARAILRDNKILILDEATANVDPKTDDLIQKTIVKKFNNCTVLTIAHRLNTIMDSDKVLVMENGQKVEFDHPHILLQDTGGCFTRMLKETGPSMSHTLKTIARASYEKELASNS